MSKKPYILIITFLILGAFVFIIFSMGIIGVPISRDSLRGIRPLVAPSPINVQYLTPNIIYIYDEYLPQLYPEVINPSTPLQDYMDRHYLCNLAITVRPPSGDTRVGIVYLKITLHSEFDDNNVYEQLVTNIEYHPDGTPYFINEAPWDLEDIVITPRFFNLKEREGRESGRPEYTIGTFLVGAKGHGIIDLEIGVATFKQVRGRFIREDMLGKAIVVVLVEPGIPFDTPTQPIESSIR